MDFVGVIKQVWTIACHTVMQALRMWILLVVVGFMIVLVLSMPSLLKSDETQMGQVRMVLTYSVWLVTFILSILTIFLSTSVLSSEVRGRQILLLDPKPAPRGAVLLGKWLGVMLVNTALLISMMFVIYMLTRHHVGRPWRQWVRTKEGRTKQEVSPEAYKRFVTEAFVARVSVKPPLPDSLKQRVEEEYQKRKKDNTLPEEFGGQYARQKLYQEFSRRAWDVVPGQAQTWKLSGLPKLKADQDVLLRFRHHGPDMSPDYKIPGRFVINEGDPSMRRIPDDPVGANLFPVGRTNSFVIPGNVVRDDGTVEVTYFNVDRRGNSAHFPYTDGIEILYPAAGMSQNFVRAGFVILCQLAFIAICGICLTTFVGFPVAVLTTIVIYVACLARVYMQTTIVPEIFILGHSDWHPGMDKSQVDYWVRLFIAKFFMLFPDLRLGGIIDALTNGRLIDTGFLARAFLFVAVIRGMTVAAFGWLIYHRRELAIFSPNA